MQAFLNQYERAIGYPVMGLISAVVALTVVDGGQPSALLLLLLLLPLVPKYIRNYDPQLNYWLIALICPLITAIPLFIGSHSGEALDAPARYIAAALCLLALSGQTIRPVWVLRAASLGTIFTLIYKHALVLHPFVVDYRVDWGVGVLESAYLGAVILTLTICHFFFDREQPLWRIISIVGTICGLVIVVKTGSRGTWPAIMFVCFLQLLVAHISTLKKVLIAATAIVVMLVSVVYSPAVSQRISVSINEVKGYFYENDHANSLGYRLDFWSIAVIAFKESPIWGVNYQRRSEIMDEFIAANPESRHIGNDGRSSSHNEILNVLSKKGLVGLIGILLLYFVPLRYFMRMMKRKNSWQVRRLATTGVGVVSTLMICGLSEAPLMNVRVATSYSFILIFLYHMIRVSVNEPSRESIN